MLKCIREESQGKDEKEEVVEKEVTQVVKLPVTYDSIALVVAFCVIMAVIIALVIFKSTHNVKKAKH